MCSHVMLNRLDGDIVAAQCPLASGFILFKGLQIAGKPIIFHAIGVCTLFQVFMPCGTALPCNTNSFNLLQRRLRYVDIQACVRGKPFLQHLLHNNPAIMDRRSEVSVSAVVLKGKPNSRNIIKRSLYGRSHSSGINQTHGRIGPVVNP